MKTLFLSMGVAILCCGCNQTSTTSTSPGASQQSASNGLFNDAWESLEEGLGSLNQTGVSGGNNTGNSNPVSGSVPESGDTATTDDPGEDLNDSESGYSVTGGVESDMG